MLFALFGPKDTFRRLLERRLKIKLYSKQERITLHGSQLAVDRGHSVLANLINTLNRGQMLFLHDVERVITLYESDDAPDFLLDCSQSEDDDSTSEFTAHEKANILQSTRPIPTFTTYDQRQIQPKTPNQTRYVELIADHDITFGVGPAGTGKTYLAMASAIHSLKQHEVKRIILTRPAVEAGEKLGFLPGSLIDKVNPYLRPLYDALFEMLGPEQAGKAIEDKVIEVAPLAFMRGRTLNQSFVILDEAQNTTQEQMRMFLTRLGYSSKAVITGDLTQTDLGNRSQSGLSQASRILQGVKGIAHMELTTADVVRHPLVRAIIKAYEVEDEYYARKRQERQTQKRREYDQDED
jgi:phosphate starvation-inducible PhoH-like protein